jgi:hypothetical protein
MNEPKLFARIVYPTTPIHGYPSGESVHEKHCREVVNGHLVAREKNLSPTMEGPQGVRAAAERAEGRRLALCSDLPPSGLPMFLRRQAE